MPRKANLGGSLEKSKTPTESRAASSDRSYTSPVGHRFAKDSDKDTAGPTRNLPAGRFAFVDALRAVAAVSVFLFHSLAGQHIPGVYASFSPTMQLIIQHSDVGVAIFFVLSGFVISHSLFNRELSIANVGRFMLKRSLRLDPPYWVTIALTCLIAIAKGAYSFSALQIAVHLAYAQDLLGFGNISPIFWTLCLEVQFYLVFALLLLTRLRSILILAFVASIPLSAIVLWHGLFTTLWYGFLLGVGAYMSWCDRKNVYLFLPYASCLGIIAVHRGDAFMIVSVTTSLSLYIVAALGRMATLMNWRWIQFLGTISYSLYLIHNPITGITFRVGQVLGTTISAEILTWVAAICASVAAAWIMWRVVERPSMKLSQMIQLKRCNDDPLASGATRRMVESGLS